VGQADKADALGNHSTIRQVGMDLFTLRMWSHGSHLQT
jgi:hypothetical protein